jgi:biopolymer transport protein ExbD
VKLQKLDEDEPAINLTPMIDVVFTLLVFFMLATTFAERERMLDIQLPFANAANANAAKPQELVINVLRDGSVSIDGRAVQGEQLTRVLSDAARRGPGTLVTVRGDRHGYYNEVVHVLDECRRAGLDNVSLSTLKGG